MSGLEEGAAPLLGEGRYSNGIHATLTKFIDIDEVKGQAYLALPMILTSVFSYLILLVSVMLAGHLGDLQLAGATLANSWATVSGFAVMVGLSGAVETLCGQAYGGEQYGMMGIYLQASCVTSFVFSVIISVLWFYSEPVLILLHQDPEIAREAAVYMRHMIPSLFAYGFLNNALRFLQVQSIVLPPVALSLVALLVHVGIAYALVHATPLGFAGAPLAVSVSTWLLLVLLVVYVSRLEKGRRPSARGLPLPSLRLYLKFALPSAAMVCLEYWAFEILVLLAGLLSDPVRTTSVIAMCVNTEAIAYMVIYGLSAAVSTRVSNELGAGSVGKAKAAMAVTVKLSLLLALVIALLLLLGRKLWAGFFSSSVSIVRSFASMAPLLAASITLDSVQGVLSGVARGCGWQLHAMLANFATFYFVGVPIACLLGFKLGLSAKGLWIGLVCGLACQATTLFVIAVHIRWGVKTSLPTRERDGSIEE